MFEGGNAGVFEANPPNGVGLFSCAGEDDWDGVDGEIVGLGVVAASEPPEGVSLGESVCGTKSSS